MRDEWKLELHTAIVLHHHVTCKGRIIGDECSREPGGSLDEHGGHSGLNIDADIQDTLSNARVFRCFTWSRWGSLICNRLHIIFS